MLFLVELDHVKSGTLSTPAMGSVFIEKVIFPTLARAGQLVKEKKILSGGPVLGRVALRFIMEADSAEHVDRMITSLPIWPLQRRFFDMGSRRGPSPGLSRRTFFRNTKRSSQDSGFDETSLGNHQSGQRRGGVRGRSDRK